MRRVEFGAGCGNAGEGAVAVGGRTLTAEMYSECTGIAGGTMSPSYDGQRPVCTLRVEKRHPILMSITSRNINPFYKFFHRHTVGAIFPTKTPITLSRHTTETLTHSVVKRGREERGKDYSDGEERAKKKRKRGGERPRRRLSIVMVVVRLASVRVPETHGVGYRRLSNVAFGGSA